MFCVALGGTTVVKAWYYRWSDTTAHHHGTTAEGRGQGVKSWAGVVSSTPYPFASSPGSSSSLQRHLAAGRLRQPSVSGPFLSISFGGVDPHLVLLPWMPLFPPFLFSSFLVFRSCVLGAIVVASLDFWPNLGLSRLEKATRLFGLMFGRFIFEFGIPGSAGSDHGSRNPLCPVSGGTTAHLARYYRWSGTAAVEARYYRQSGTTARPYGTTVRQATLGAEKART